MGTRSHPDVRGAVPVYQPAPPPQELRQHPRARIRIARACRADGSARVYWMGHENDERQIVIDAELGKIVKRFRDTETAWMDAERWANDYAAKVE